MKRSLKIENAILVTLNIIGIAILIGLLAYIGLSFRILFIRWAAGR